MEKHRDFVINANLILNYQDINEGFMNGVEILDRNYKSFSILIHSIFLNIDKTNKILDTIPLAK